MGWSTCCACKAPMWIPDALEEAAKRSRGPNGIHCPCCTRSFTNLQRHMETEHPDGARKMPNDVQTHRISAMKLCRTELEILNALDRVCGFIVRDVATHVTYSSFNNRARSAAVRYWLRDLQQRGLVETIDDRRPPCWRLTEAGIAARTLHRTDNTG